MEYRYYNLVGFFGGCDIQYSEDNMNWVAATSSNAVQEAKEAKVSKDDNLFF